MQVQVARCNLDRKQLDFVIVDEKHPARSLATLGSTPQQAKQAKYSKKSHTQKKTKSRRR